MQFELGGRKTAKKRVSYHIDPQVGNYHYGEHHPMKPHRMTLTTHLVLGYGLQDKLSIYSPRMATFEELSEFHSKDYLDFLRRITPENVDEMKNLFTRFNIGDDCPIFDGMYDFCTRYAGCSLDAARKLCLEQSDIAINWSGGLHHAKKAEPSGFCYVNDIVLAILSLLRYYPRVLYIDIDIHHGDGVQEAFYQTDRVFTLSFHKYNGDFFPGTGNNSEIGQGPGKYFTMNIPLKDGIDDQSYLSLYKSIIEQVLQTYRPSAIVLQCGADSLGCDRLGYFNLSIKAHGTCVKFTKSFGLPLLVMGGGGYTVKNVALAWCYETAICVDTELTNNLPKTKYFEFWAPEYKLHPRLSVKMENQNSQKYLNSIRIKALEQLRYLHGAPSVQMQEIPPDIESLVEDGDAKLVDDFDEENIDCKGDL